MMKKECSCFFCCFLFFVCGVAYRIATCAAVCEGSCPYSLRAVIHVVVCLFVCLFLAVQAMTASSAVATRRLRRRPFARPCLTSGKNSRYVAFPVHAPPFIFPVVFRSRCHASQLARLSLFLAGQLPSKKNKRARRR